MQKHCLLLKALLSSSKKYGGNESGGSAESIMKLAFQRQVKEGVTSIGTRWVAQVVNQASATQNSDNICS